MKTKQLTRKKEFGDFQTPLELSSLMVNILNEKNIYPNVIIEPTCGVGNILLTAYEFFHPQKAIGIEINNTYCKKVLEKSNGNRNILIVNDDIFTSMNTIKKVINDKDVCLFIGNPPWVTNSELSSVESTNVPQKNNLKNLRGIDAITGKSNFDITEYIIIKLIEEFNPQKSIFAFLCKTSVARNILKYCWKNNIYYCGASMFPVNSKQYFGAAVDACYFVIDATKKNVVVECKVFDSIENKNYKSTIGLNQNTMIVNMDTFKSHNYLGKSDYTWRNGIKHDCSKVMELDIIGSSLVNGYGETVDIESDLLYPLLKSSDIANGTIGIRKKVLVTQKRIGEETKYIQSKYPKTWQYLNDHANDFIKRKSNIYKNKPNFSIFSIGDYSFYLFKIAISGLYKKINFKIVYPIDGKPVMVDDTCNFISCKNESETHMIFSLLTDEKTRLFLESIIFWDSKRPITTEILNSIDLKKIASENHLHNHYSVLAGYNQIIPKENLMQIELF
jgi:16S rRNA A1518/A1519 N6-dimethyltransferase RsmA/KsgA/DIM1 with predicted DNA glycosylase/AP lyase activity